MLLEPHQLRQRPEAGHAVVGLVHDVGTHFGFQARGLLGSARIRPVDGAADRLVVCVQQHGGMGGRVQRQRRDVLRVDARFLQQIADVAHEGVVAVLRVLLRPAVMRIIGGIFPARGRDDHAVFPQQRRLGGRPAEVHAQQVFHALASCAMMPTPSGITVTVLCAPRRFVASASAVFTSGSQIICMASIKSRFSAPVTK